MAATALHMPKTPVKPRRDSVGNMGIFAIKGAGQVLRDRFDRNGLWC